MITPKITLAATPHDEYLCDHCGFPGDASYSLDPVYPTPAYSFGAGDYLFCSKACARSFLAESRHP